MGTIVIDSLIRGGSGISPFALTTEADVRTSYITVTGLGSDTKELLPVWRRLPFMRVFDINTGLDYRLGSDITIAGQVWSTLTPGAGIYQLLSEKNANNGYVGLDATGKINPSFINNIYANNSYVTTNTTTRNALTTLTGDVVTTTADSKIWVKLNNNPPVNINADYAELLFPGVVLSVNGNTGAVTVSISNLLGTGTNTTDFNNQVNIAPAVTALNSSVSSFSGSLNTLTNLVNNNYNFNTTHIGLANLASIGINPTSAQIGFSLVWDGSVYTLQNVTSGALSSPLSTKGDVWIYSSLNTRLPVGTDTQVLSADSTQTTGLKWINNSTLSIGSVITSATLGSVLFAGSGSTLQQDNSNFYWDNHVRVVGIGESLILGGSINTVFTNSNIVSKSNLNTYTQIVSQNSSAGISASSGFVAVTDDGNDTSKFIELGINSSGFTGTVLPGARNGFVYVNTASLLLAADTDLRFYSGGAVAANERLVITSAGIINSLVKFNFTQTTTTAAFNIPGFATDPSVPVEGDIAYNLTSHLLKYYNGTSWLAAGNGTVTSVTSANGDATITNTTTTPIITINSAPNLSGTPALPNHTTATTQSVGSYSSDLATTNYVRNEINNLAVTLAMFNATGDIIYRNSSGSISVLPIGANGKVLTVVAGIPAWV